MFKLTIFVVLTCLPVWCAETAVLQLKVLEGDGAVHVVGSRSARPIVLQVTDETGRPVDGVAVSFRLSDEDHGVFRSGMKTEILVTGADGRVSVWGIQWGAVAGPVRIRVTALKGQARAGVVIAQYVSDSASSAPGAQSGKGSRWKLIGLAAAGAVGAGLAAGRVGSKTSGSGAGAAAASTPAAVGVGIPTVTVGKP